MTYVALVPLDQLDRKLVQLVEVIARIRDFPRLVAEPAHRLQDALKVAALLRLRALLPLSLLPFILFSLSLFIRSNRR